MPGISVTVHDLCTGRTNAVGWEKRKRKEKGKGVHIKWNHPTRNTFNIQRKAGKSGPEDGGGGRDLAEPSTCKHAQGRPWENGLAELGVETM